MHVKTILNRVEEFKGFVVALVSFNTVCSEGLRLEARIRPRKGSRPVCGGCGERGPVYDHGVERCFQYVSLWGIPVVLLYVMRRVNCPRCGVRTERVPWAAGKSPITRTLALFLSDWAKRLSWQEVADCFHVSWRQVCASVSWVVQWGLAHRDVLQVEAIGVDEVHFGKGQRYMTLVYQLCGPKPRLLFVGRRHDAAALEGFFQKMGAAWCARLQYVCTDMWVGYRKAIRQYLPDAVHILDRFHIVKLLNDALEEVRREEAHELARKGIRLLKGLRYAFLKRPENLTPHQRENLHGVLNRRSLRTVRAYLWKEKFQLFWDYMSPYWARWYLQRWCKGAMRSRLKPIKRFVNTVRKHEDLIINWFEARKAFNSGAVEGLNRKVNLITRKAYGYKSFEVLQIALYHTLGDLPRPEATHRF